MAGRLALAFALALVTTQPVLAQSPEAPTATFMQSSKVEVMGGVGGIPEIANSSWYFTPTLNVAATIWATEHWGAGVWYINATAEVEYLANKWYRDQFSISQLSLRYRHRIPGSRTYGYIGVGVWNYRTWKRWTGRTTESELAFVEQVPTMELMELIARAPWREAALVR